MTQVAAIVLPVFLLIVVGYVAGLSRWISPEAGKGLGEFTFNLAIPALLFRTVAVADLPDVAPYRLWLSFFGAALTVWLCATVITHLVLRRPAADAPAIAMSSVFGNVVLLGIPLSLYALGPQAGGPIALLVSVHTPLLWTAGSLHMALAARDGAASIGSLLAGLARDLARNPIILAIAAGALWRLTGLGLQPVVDKVLILLAQAGVPCALVALGLSLTGFQIKGQVGTLATIIALKMGLMPLLAWLLATQWLHLPKLAAGVVVLFAAMPTGANAYLFASNHQRAVNSTSGAVALGTVLSIFTAMLLVYAVIGA